ncbi:MAG: Methyltransferase type 11 [Parcubacteria group bacterium GW2011_GWC2_42_6]|nr:MAG: Methyltransferase type 11 [Parcubacteria group bacterium GW2011_GWA2_42_11]KKS68126.1 MAG: Methyltransferase type 11 [Parcubacteria group bacterium GW2011_GWC2_42_6]
MKNFLTAKITRRYLNKFITEHANSDGLVLDLGCGSGKYAKYFKQRIGFDMKPGQGVDVVGDAHQLPFEDEKFDTILCAEVLEHLREPAKAIVEMRRVLKKGGLLILSTRFIFPLHDTPGDFWRFTKYGLKELFKGWEIIELTEEEGTIKTLAVLLQRVGYQTELRGGKFSKLIIFALAKFIDCLPNLIRKEYGDIGKNNSEKNIMASGYYLVGRKTI